jgi:Ca-activated chloride channel family protein
VLGRLQQLQAGGGTNLHAGLAAAMKKTDDERTTAVILVTDGVANVGPTAHADFLQLVRDRDVRLFTFVIGNSANRPLLEDLAKASGGFAMDISPQDDIHGRIVQAKSKVLYQKMHDVEVRFAGGGVKDLSPVTIGSLYQGQQAVVFGRYTKAEPVRVTMRAKVSGEEREWECQVVLPEADLDNPEIERLWALAAIDETMAEIRDEGETPARRERVVALGTGYSLVTDYTSMVVVKEAEFEGLGIERRNDIRVQRERKAEEARVARPVQDYRADSSPENSMFRGASSPGVGSGPMSPLLLVLIGGCAALVRRKNNR